MADLITNYSDIRFDAQGKPYLTTQSGQRSYLPPAAAAQSGNALAQAWAASQGEVITRNPDGTASLTSNAAPDATFAHARGEWNPDTGEFDQGMNWSGLGGALTGTAAVAGPAVIGPTLSGLIGGSSAAGAASGAAFDAAPSISSAAGAANAAGVGGGGGMSLWGSIGKFLGSNLGSQAIQTGGQIASGLIGANAAGKAADQQAEAANKALEFEKGVYDRDVADFAPWQALSGSTAGRLSDLVNRPASAPVTADSVYGAGQLPVRSVGRSATPAATLSGMVGGGGGTVTLQAPDGTTKQFAANDPKVQLAMARGAQRV